MIKIDKKYVNKYLNNRMTEARLGSTEEINSFVVFLVRSCMFFSGSGFLAYGGQSRIFYNGE